LTDAQLYLDPDVFEGWRAMVEGTFDRFIFERLMLVEDLKGKVIWDIGAHFGYHSLAFARLVGSTGAVFSFEPNPFNLDRLRMNRDKNETLAPAINVKQCALSDTTATAEFIFSRAVDDSASSGSHISSIDAPLSRDAYLSFEKTIVPTATIDSLLSAGELRSADVVKIDVEGAEALVLKGGRDFFAIRRPLIFMEVHTVVMMLTCLNLLRDWGYRVELLDERSATLSRCFVVASPG